jgi:hypothetical protein
MTSIEISGYVQIVIGIAGIGVTMLTAPASLDAMNRVRIGEGLPSEFGGASGMVRVFAITFAFTVFTFLIGLGLSVTLSTIARAMGAANPMLMSAMMIGALFCLATSGTLAIYRSPFAVPGFVGSVLLVILSCVAALQATSEGFWPTLAFGTVIFMVTGVASLISAASKEH